MQEPKNEAAICAGVLRFLERFRDKELQVIAQPDSTERQRPAVELVAQSPSARFVIEHTRIESFPAQIADGKMFTELMEPLEANLAGKLRPGHYEIIIAPGDASGVARKEMAAVRNSIESWAVDMAANLRLGPADEGGDPDAPWSITETPAGVPFAVTLQRNPPDDRVIVFVARFSPAEGEQARRERVRTALDRKCPKLLDAKQQFGAVSILVLESDDIALANRHVVSQTVMEAIQNRSDTPDMILLVETDRGLEWLLWLVKDFARLYADIENPGPHPI